MNRLGFVTEKFHLGRTTTANFDVSVGPCFYDYKDILEEAGHLYLRRVGGVLLRAAWPFPVLPAVPWVIGTAGMQRDRLFPFLKALTLEPG